MGMYPVLEQQYRRVGDGDVSTLGSFDGPVGGATVNDEIAVENAKNVASGFNDGDIPAAHRAGLELL